MASKIQIAQTYKQILAMCEQESIPVTLKGSGEYKDNKTYSIPLSDGGEYVFYTYVETTKVPSICGRFNNSAITRNAIKGTQYNDKWNFHETSCEDLKNAFMFFVRRLKSTEALA